ncbi:MAG: transglutaminase domain-containing protein [Candidatus Scatovivens sp.]
MKKKSNKILSFFEFIITFIIIIIFALTLVTALDVLGIIYIPEQYSLTNFLTTSTEISLKDYTEIMDGTNLEVINTSSKTEGKQEETNIELPEGIQSLYSDNTGTDKQQNTSKEKYYYKQLDNYGKIIYDKMYSNIENLKSGTYIVKFDTEFNSLLQQDDGNKIMDNAFQSSLNALIYDNPQIFYLDITKMYLYTETTTIVVKKTYKVYIGPEEGKTYLADGFNSKEDINNAISKINQKLEEIKFNLGGSEYTKIKSIHNYLIDNIEYDQTISRPNIYNIYGALIDGFTVCEGYSKAFKYILDEIGIDCMFVCGVGTDSDGQQENHAWNYVKLNGNWYAIDVTWDDPIIIGGRMLTDSYRYKYFLKGSNEFYKDHFEDGNIIEGVKFYYPVLSQSNF